MTTIKFDSDVPVALHEEMRALLEPYLPLITREVDLLQVFISGETGGEAAIIVTRPYHVAHVVFDTTFFGLTDEEKAKVVAHEMMHVFVDIFTREAKQLIDCFVPENLEEYAALRLEELEERMTNTLGLVVGGLVKDLNEERETLRFKEGMLKWAADRMIEEGEDV